MSVRISPTLCLTLAIASSAFAQDLPLDKDKVAHKKPTYSPYVQQNYPTRILWGDTHVHTAMSLDAGLFGTTLRPEQAYRFARGEEVRSSSGLRVRLVRPLDFLVVADHAEYAGVAVMIEDDDPTLLADATWKRLHGMFNCSKE